MLTIKKPLIAAVSMALGLGMAAGAQAAAETFDTHSSDGILTISGFDWSPTTFLAQGGQQAINNFLTGGGSTTFNVLTQASLSSFLDANGSSIGGLTGLNSQYQITMVAKFQESVTSVVGTTANFATVTSSPIIVEIYYDRLTPLTGFLTGTTANPLTGFGFNDGRLILSATSVQAASGSFTVDATVPASPLDQTSNGDQYPGQSTVTGDGSNGVIRVGNITQDSTFFLNLLNSFGVTFSNIGQSLPFEGPDPMDCFTQTVTNTTVGTNNAFYACDNNHVLGTYAAQGAPLDGNGYVPVTGPVNGLFTPGGTLPNPDFVAQTDFNSNFNARVPEPTSLALMGLGLGVLGFGAARRRHPKAV